MQGHFYLSQYNNPIIKNSIFQKESCLDKPPECAPKITVCLYKWQAKQNGVTASL